MYQNVCPAPDVAHHACLDSPCISHLSVLVRHLEQVTRGAQVVLRLRRLGRDDDSSTSTAAALLLHHPCSPEVRTIDACCCCCRCWAAWCCCGWLVCSCLLG